MKLEFKHVAIGVGALLVYRHFKTQFTPTQPSLPAALPASSAPAEPGIMDKALSIFKGNPEKKAAKKAAKASKTPKLKGKAKRQAKKAAQAKQTKLGSLLM